MEHCTSSSLFTNLGVCHATSAYFVISSDECHCRENAVITATKGSVRPHRLLIALVTLASQKAQWNNSPRILLAEHSAARMAASASRFR